MDPAQPAPEDGPVPRPRTPADVWTGLLRRLGRGLGERRWRVRGVGFRLEELDFRSGGSAWSFGRLRDVRVVAADVEVREGEGLVLPPGLDGLVADRVVAECDTVALAGGPRTSTATASAITLTVTLPPVTVQRLLDASGSWVRVVFADGELRVPWMPGTDLVVEPEVADDGTIALRTLAVRSFGQRIGLPGWLPSTVTVAPVLPAGLRLLGMCSQADGDGGGVIVRAVLDDPPPIPVEPRRVRDLVVGARRGARVG